MSNEVPSFKKRGKRPQGIRTKASSNLTEEPIDASTITDEKESSVSDLLALRRLRAFERSSAGIDIAKLNSGDSSSSKRKRGDEDEDTPSASEDSFVPGLKISRPHTPVSASTGATNEEEESAALTKSLIKGNNFTQQTNVVDVDKHMMAFIEEELKKRRGMDGGLDRAREMERIKESKKLDPRDELFTIAEQYRIKKGPVQEGNVTLSTAMLTAIPEVDLGIDNRLKNIEETEKAKRILFEKQQADAARMVRKEDIEADNYAASRFYRAPIVSNYANNTNMSDAETLRLAREAAARGEIDGFEMVSVGSVNQKQTASDDTVVARYKARAAQNSQSAHKSKIHIH